MRFAKVIPGPLALFLALTLALAACDGGEPKDVSLALEIRDRALASEAALEVKQNDNVTITVTADETVGFHLHGYDLETVAGPGAPGTLAFIAAATGSFPFTIHVTDGGANHGATVGDAHDETIAAPEGMSVSLTVAPDPVAGHNLTLATTGLDFAPGRAGLPHVPGEGHAHVYVDGVKAARIYGNHYHLDGLSTGVHTLRVSLNANSHEVYARDGAPVEAIAEITVLGGPGGGHGGQGGAGAEVELGRLNVLPR